ncbi:MAG TPA: hypothetical protein VIP09_02385 [Dehalococcoidia bacterium]|jgi:hypothetical protein
MADGVSPHYYTAIVVTPAIVFRRYALFLTVAAMSLAACHPTPADVIPVIEDAGEISIHVVNRNWIDVTVYISHSGGIRSRLGLAVASTTTDFIVPLRILGAGREYRLLGDPLGLSIVISTETLVGQPGDEVTWQLEPSFAQSTVVVH